MATDGYDENPGYPLHVVGLTVWEEQGRVHIAFIDEQDKVLCDIDYQSHQKMIENLGEHLFDYLGINWRERVPIDISAPTPKTEKASEEPKNNRKLTTNPKLEEVVAEIRHGRKL
tara:strand:- start:1212 stop:1556 length:345 start_codon:yes stop_codon:yes gene_type:complete